MKIVDLHDPNRVNRKPNDVKVLFSSNSIEEQGFSIRNVELRLYLEKFDEKLGPYSLITSFVDTDKGSVEMIYDEGFRGEEALVLTENFLTSHMGLSGLILRSIITIREQLEKNTS
jgi:hypothetical protein